MQITLENISKKYIREWIFRELNMELLSGSRTAIVGGNGSGKSTCIQIISGYLTPSGGRISWKHEQKSLSINDVYKQVSLCAPYMNVEEELNLMENVSFFLKFKSLQDGMTAEDFAQIIELEKNAHKPLKYFSSGMRQRVKLGLAILSDSSLLLLDEPTSHLDHKSIDWFQSLLQQYCKNRTLVVASNSEQTETFYCTERIEIERYKQ